MVRVPSSPRLRKRTAECAELGDEEERHAVNRVLHGIKTETASESATDEDDTASQEDNASHEAAESIAPLPPAAQSQPLQTALRPANPSVPGDSEFGDSELTVCFAVIDVFEPTEEAYAAVLRKISTQAAGSSERASTILAALQQHRAVALPKRQQVIDAVTEATCRRCASELAHMITDPAVLRSTIGTLFAALPDHIQAWLPPKWLTHANQPSNTPAAHAMVPAESSRVARSRTPSRGRSGTQANQGKKSTTATSHSRSTAGSAPTQAATPRALGEQAESPGLADNRGAP